MLTKVYKLAKKLVKVLKLPLFEVLLLVSVMLKSKDK